MTNSQPESRAAASDPHEASTEPRLTVKLPAFEGPLDLLLHLIRKHEIDITDIPIVLVAEQYIEYLNLMKELNLDLAGEYLVMAATLIHIKSRMLLPQKPEDVAGDDEDPRADLVRQLLEYEKFKRVADVLYERDRVERATFPRGAIPEFEAEDEALFEASLFDLVAAFKGLVEERRRDKPFRIDAYQVSVADRVADLLAALDGSGRLEFRDLFAPDGSREDWIVTFLAVLELARLGAVRILQRVHVGDIVLIKRDDAPTSLVPGAGVGPYGGEAYASEPAPFVVPAGTYESFALNASEDDDSVDAAGHVDAADPADDPADAADDDADDDHADDDADDDDADGNEA